MYRPESLTGRHRNSPCLSFASTDASLFAKVAHGLVWVGLLGVGFVIARVFGGRNQASNLRVEQILQGLQTALFEAFLAPAWSIAWKILGALLGECAELNPAIFELCG